MEGKKREQADETTCIGQGGLKPVLQEVITQWIRRGEDGTPFL